MTLATWAAGDTPHTNYVIGAETVIEYGADMEILCSGSHEDFGPCDDEMDGVEQSKTHTTGEPEFSVSGSYHFQTKQQCYDDSPTAEAYGKLVWKYGTSPGWVMALAHKPTYSP